MIHRTTLCEAARHVADDLVFGSNNIIPDLAYTKLLLNFGSNYFEGEQTSRWMDYTTTMARENNGFKTIVVEPRLSQVAGKADEWVPVRPGKDVVVLLAMARVIDRGRHDRRGIPDHLHQLARPRRRRRQDAESARRQGNAGLGCGQQFGEALRRRRQAEPERQLQRRRQALPDGFPALYRQPEGHHAAIRRRGLRRRRGGRRCAWPGFLPRKRASASSSPSTARNCVIALR